jgi:hypothetical protein
MQYDYLRYPENLSLKRIEVGRLCVYDRYRRNSRTPPRLVQCPALSGALSEVLGIEQTGVLNSAHS